MFVRLAELMWLRLLREGLLGLLSLGAFWRAWLSFWLPFRPFDELFRHLVLHLRPSATVSRPWIVGICVVAVLIRSPVVVEIYRRSHPSEAQSYDSSLYLKLISC